MQARKWSAVDHPSEYTTDMRLSAGEQEVEAAARAGGVLQGALFWLFQSYSNGQNMTNGVRRVLEVPLCTSWCSLMLAC
jgi:hypothetical protein